MRVVSILLIATALTLAQDEAKPETRFDVLYNARFFKQGTPKETLAAVIKAGELGQYDYIGAYLMDEPAANALIMERAQELQEAVETEFRLQRAKEKADPFKPAPPNALPSDPKAFRLRVEEEAVWRGWRQFTNEIGERFRNDPSHIRELNKYLRDGDVTITDTTAKITLKSEPGKAMHFKLAGGRWFLEDRTQDAAP